MRKKEEMNVGDLNSVIRILKEILKITYVLFIILAIYAITIIFKEWHLKEIILMILKTISPLFIGLFLAWLFDPFISLLEKKGVRRTIGALLTYIMFLGCILLILGSIFPVLSAQMNDFVSIIPKVFENIQLWITKFFYQFQNSGIDVASIEEGLFNNLKNIVTSLTSDLPEKIISFVTALVSGAGTFLVGTIIGFYLSIGFKNSTELIMSLLPENIRNQTKGVLVEVNNTCRAFVKGALIDATLIFVVSSIAFMICGLKAPLLFGLFCGITNVIPYVGPYIGGAPAVLVAFSQGTTTGFFVLLSIIIIQAIEGNFLQALIMAKSTKLHPVTIILGLLVFGHFFGIIGMVISTPIIGTVKAVLMYFNSKFHFIDFKSNNEGKVE